MKGSEVTKEGVCLQALGLLVTMYSFQNWSAEAFFFEDEGGKQSQQVAKETSDLKEKSRL